MKLFSQFTTFGKIMFFMSLIPLVVPPTIIFYTFLIINKADVGLVLSLCSLVCETWIFLYGFFRGKYPLSHYTKEYYEKSEKELEEIRKKFK